MSEEVQRSMSRPGDAAVIDPEVGKKDEHPDRHPDGRPHHTPNNPRRLETEVAERTEEKRFRLDASPDGEVFAGLMVDRRV